jgi:protein-disulfide isomerase
MLWTIAAVVIGGIVIAGAYFLTKQASGPVAFGSPIPPNVVTPPGIPASGRVLGDANAKATIDVYEDFRCIFCFDFTMQEEPQIVDQYVKTGKAKLVYHDLLTIDRAPNSESRDAANAALCATDQGKFWTLHDWLFTNQAPREQPGAFTKDRLLQIGQAAALDMTKYTSCVQQGTHNAEVASEQTAIPKGVTGTPAIFVNGTAVTFTGNATADVQAVGAAVDHVRSGATASPAPSASPSAS